MQDVLAVKLNVTGKKPIRTGIPLPEEPMLEAGAPTLLPSKVSFLLYDKRDVGQTKGDVDSYPALEFGMTLGIEKPTTVYLMRLGDEIKPDHLLSTNLDGIRAIGKKLSEEMSVPFLDVTLADEHLQE